MHLECIECSVLWRNVICFHRRKKIWELFCRRTSIFCLDENPIIKVFSFLCFQFILLFSKQIKTKLYMEEKIQTTLMMVMRLWRCIKGTIRAKIQFEPENERNSQMLLKEKQIKVNTARKPNETNKTNIFLCFLFSFFIQYFHNAFTDRCYWLTILANEYTTFEAKNLKKRASKLNDRRKRSKINKYI